jgi:DNA (cytosine-5)-methyltransferase 1
VNGPIYNEIDPAAAASIQAIMEDGVIPRGLVETRSIKELTHADIEGRLQAHFFAGAGAWAYAARLAGWPDWWPLWTGSCPCQPFSQAGRGRGVADERHLWPDFFRLIKATRPPVVVGEQVAGKAGYGWFDGVRTDLEGEGYSCRAVDIPACAVDAPNIRQRLYWVAVADAERDGQQGGVSKPGGLRQASGERSADQSERRDEFERSGVTLGDAIEPRLERQPRHGDGATGWAQPHRPVAEADGGDVADADLQRRGEARGLRQGQITELGGRFGDGRNGSFWADHEWLVCHDGKARRTKPGLRLLVNGMAGRVHCWRIAGNGINIPLAVEVLAALKETLIEDYGWTV